MGFEHFNSVGFVVETTVENPRLYDGPAKTLRVGGLAHGVEDRGACAPVPGPGVANGEDELGVGEILGEFAPETDIDEVPIHRLVAPGGTDQIALLRVRVDVLQMMARPEPSPDNR